MKTLVNIEDHEIGNVLATFGIAERKERIVQLLLWGQARALEWVAEQDAKEKTE
ncbi:hypothetical protein [Burkholderia ubonensis]|uniref:hypothetical protein n=1 Tax=Burkholderia ubonensis TaxID=101571 RepID=UPI000A90AA9A|nr:hypothetical protein [Burkholderia ubonensis]